MKRIGLIVILVLLLCGCGAEQTMETLGNVWQEQEAAVPLEVTLTLPQEAGIQTIRSDHGQIWFCRGYEITTQTLPSGNISATVQNITGFQKDALTFLQTSAGQIDRYECVWVAAGEAGDEVHRAVILDDGSFHYVLTVCAAAEEAGSLQASWDALLDSFSLSA